MSGGNYTADVPRDSRDVRLTGAAGYSTTNRSTVGCRMPDETEKPDEIEVTPEMIEAGTIILSAKMIEIIEMTHPSVMRGIVAEILSAALECRRELD